MRNVFVGCMWVSAFCVFIALWGILYALTDHEQRIKALETNRVVIYGPGIQSEDGRVNISGGGMITNYGFEMKR